MGTNEADDELPSTKSFRFTIEREQWPEASGEARTIGDVRLLEIGQMPDTIADRTA